MSFWVTNNPDESQRFTFLADSLRGVEGDFENVPFDHVLDDLESGRPVHVSVIKDRLKIDVAFVLAVESLADRVEENLVSDGEEAIGIRLVDGASRGIVFRTRERLRL